MPTQFIERCIMKGPDGGLLDGSHHSLCLAISTWMVGLGEAVLDAELVTGFSERVAHRRATDDAAWGIRFGSGLSGA